MSASVFVVTGALGAGLVWAQEPAVPKVDEYLDCVRDVSIDPRAAHDKASAWRARGGGVRAMHCQALALDASGRHGGAAKVLVRLARLDEMTRGEQKAELFLQAGHSWLLAGDTAKAVETFSEGLGVGARSPALAGDLQTARARAYGLAGKPKKAFGDLDAVLKDLPQHLEALLLRAALYRKAGNKAACAGDLANLLTLQPDHSEGLLERGYLRLDVLDMAGAKRDFMRVVELAPKSLAAAAARTALSKITFREESRQHTVLPD